MLRRHRSTRLWLRVSSNGNDGSYKGIASHAAASFFKLWLVGRLLFAPPPQVETTPFALRSSRRTPHLHLLTLDMPARCGTRGGGYARLVPNVLARPAVLDSSDDPALRADQQRLSLALFLAWAVFMVITFSVYAVTRSGA